MAIDIGFKTEKPFQELIVTPGDVTLGSIVFGFFVGVSFAETRVFTTFPPQFGFAVRVTLSAVQETRRAGRRVLLTAFKFSAYIFMIWLEIATDTTFAVVAWSYLYATASAHFCLSHVFLSAKIVPPSAPLFIGILVLWVCQVQCLMMIIVNRLCILHSDERQRRILRFTTAGIVTAISLSTACVSMLTAYRDTGIPAQLQINHTYIWLNHWWDRVEKSVYLLLDLTLNILFIRVVKTRLINFGLKKYDRVMKFNQYIIFVSISMDILLLGITALHNGFVYCQFHPIVYIVKLHIEMTMSQLLIKVARSTGISGYTANPTAGTVTGNRTRPNSLQVHVDTQVLTTRHADKSTGILGINTFPPRAATAQKVRQVPRRKRL
ncbi:hypothetical protein CPB85DRAFT_1452859 [Mucidula mucida]|nr:hypothetical protein CPB85DRAFT_1452859 [Mucidula mucida]